MPQGHDDARVVVPAGDPSFCRAGDTSNRTQLIHCVTISRRQTYTHSTNIVVTEYNVL